MPCGLTDVFRYCAVLYLLCFCLVSQVSQKAACTMHAEGQGIKQAIAAGLALPLLFGAQAANAITSEQVRSLTYEEVKGTGLANRCPELSGSSGELTIDSARKFKIADLCLEPKSFQIEQQVNEKRKGQAGAKGGFLFLHEFHFSFLANCLRFDRVRVVLSDDKDVTKLQCMQTCRGACRRVRDTQPNAWVGHTIVKGVGEARDSGYKMVGTR